MQDASGILLGELQIFMQEEEHIAASHEKISTDFSGSDGKRTGESWQTEDERLWASFSLFVGLLKQQNLLYEVDVGFLYLHSL